MIPVHISYVYSTPSTMRFGEYFGQIETLGRGSLIEMRKLLKEGVEQQGSKGGDITILAISRLDAA